MNWIIFGLVSFILQMYVLKHTYTITVKGTAEFDWEKAKKIGGISLDSAYNVNYQCHTNC